MLRLPDSSRQLTDLRPVQLNAINDLQVARRRIHLGAEQILEVKHDDGLGIEQVQISEMALYDLCVA